MSFVCLYARFTTCVLLCAMHAALLVLLALPLVSHTGGLTEIAAEAFSALAFLFNFAQYVRWLHQGGAAVLLPCIRALDFEGRGDSESGNVVGVVFAGIIWMLTLLGSIVVTARSHNGGLQRDYAGLEEDVDLALIVVPLSWCTAGVALAALAIAYLDKQPGIPQVTSFGTHRVVWRSDRIPMHNITAKQSSDSTTPARDHKWPQPPTPARSHWSERQVRQFGTTDSK